MMTCLRSIVLCDDIRKEDNGKNILIGVYGRDIIVGTKPAILDLTIVASFEVDDETGPIEVNLSDGQHNRPHTLTYHTADGYINFVLPVTVPLVEPREIKFSIRNPGEEWSHEVAWKFRFSETATDAPPEVAKQAEAALAETRASAVAKRPD